MTRYTLLAGDGRGTHLETGLRGLTLCGRSINVGDDDVTREPYDPGENDEHVTLCMDCSRVRNRTATGGRA